MLREEELDISPGTLQSHRNKGSGQGNENFSFIQNRVPSPLNNNFLLSAEQSRHMRQPSDGFISSAHNLMNQEEFKMAYVGPVTGFMQGISPAGICHILDQDEIGKIESSNSQGELDNSKITLFTNEDEQNEDDDTQPNNLDTEDIQVVRVNTEGSNFESNNIYNYSESQKGHHAFFYNPSNSLGAIIQNINGTTGGSFVTQQNASSYIYQNNSSKASRLQQNANGRDSVATTNMQYDENSLMNLSNSPTSVMLKRSSFIHNNSSKDQRRLSSSKFNNRQNSLMIQIAEDHKEEDCDEQDQSMIKGSNLTGKHLQFTTQGCEQVPDAQWVKPRKFDPLELPLQRNSSNDNPFSPWEKGMQVLNQKKKLDVQTNEQLNQQQMQILEQFNNFLNQQIDQAPSTLNPNQQSQLYGIPDDIACNEDEIQNIKKKLDFSRLSSVKNLSFHSTGQNQQQQQQIWLNQIPPGSFLFNTQNSQHSNASMGGDTQHYSTFQMMMTMDQDRCGIPFEELVSQHLKTTASRNYEVMSSQRTMNNPYDYREESLKAILGQQAPNIDTGRMSQNEQKPSPLKRRSSCGSARPPLLKQMQQPPQMPQKIIMNTQSHPIQQVEIVQQNCINIFQGAPPQQFTDLNAAALLHQLKVPPQSQTNSTNSQNGSVLEQHTLHQNFTRNLIQNQNQTIRCDPITDTPREPSSMLIDEEFAQKIQYLRPNMNTIITNQIAKSRQSFVHQSEQPLIEILPEDEYSHEILTSRPQKIVKGKKKSKENIVIATQKSRQQSIKGGKTQLKVSNKTSKQINNGIIGVPNFMSKTMIISKDRNITGGSPPTNSSPQVLEQHIIPLNSTRGANPMKIEHIVPNGYQLAFQKEKQKAVQNKIVKQINIQQPAQINTGKSVPTSNHSSAQTSFLNSNNIKKLAKKTITTNKKKIEISKDISIEDKTQIKKLKKKTKSIVKQPNFNGTQQIVVQKIEKPQQSKCNTHRSVSRPKSGIGYNQQEQHQPVVYHKLGQKKQSLQVIVPSAQQVAALINKENIRPNTSKVSGQVSSHNTNNKTSMFGSAKGSLAHLHKPEDLIHNTIENMKLFNPQELIKEINSHRQRQSLKQKNPNIFASVDCTSQSQEFAKRMMKTIEFNNQGHNLNSNMKSMQTFDLMNGNHQLHNQQSQPTIDLDPYHMLVSLETQRFKAHQKTSTIDASASQDNSYRAFVNQSISGSFMPAPQVNANNGRSSSGLMPKMQSPYNSKTMKNKFSTNKGKKDSQCLSNISSFDKLFIDGQGDNCKRCNELLSMLKKSRLLAR